MDRQRLLAALRVLGSLYSGTRLTVSDVDRLRDDALPEERDLDLDELAQRIAHRELRKPGVSPAAPTAAARARLWNRVRRSLY
jgi:hypothetical protein